MGEILKKPLKLLILIDAWFPHVGGGQIHAWEIAKNLADKGCDVTILTRNLGEWSQNYPKVKVVRVGKNKDFISIVGRIEYLVKAIIYSLINEYDILHAHAFSPGLIIPFVKVFRKKVTVFTVHGKGVKVAGFNIGMPVLEDLVVYGIPYDLEITVAGSTLVKKPKAKNLVVIPNGVNIDSFKYAIRPRARVKNLLYVGRLSFEKGVDLLLKALTDPELKKLRLTIVGEGPEYVNLKKISKGKNVIFKGKLQEKELMKVFRESDLLVIPSRTEGLPLVLFEGWASKLPVLATDVADNSKYIKNNLTGFLCNPSAVSIASSLKEIIKFRNLATITNNAFIKVQRYNWKNIASKTYSYYQEVYK